MTRQEALDLLNKFEFSCDFDECTNDWECEECGEALNMAIEALEQEPSAQPFTAEQIQTMQELESAQVEKAFELGKADKPTGHWTKNEGMAPPEFTGRYVCSICGDYALMSMPYGSKQELSNFCPNCGADMTGGEEE